MGYYRLGRVYPRTQLRQEYRRKERVLPLSIPQANEVQANATLTCVSSTVITAQMAIRQPGFTTLNTTSSKTFTAQVDRQATSTRTCVSTITANWQIQLSATATCSSASSVIATAETSATTFFMSISCQSSLFASAKVESLSCGTGYFCKPSSRPPKCYKLIEIRGEKSKYYQTPSKAFLAGITRCVQKDVLGAKTEVKG